MTTVDIAMTVNGRAVSGTVEPRTQLSEFLRETLNLTGTHLGCEQGVCGACTVLVDGKPQRSCISYGGDCSGGAVTTIEGFDDDALMNELRDAFSRHHALQCGYCTPGMLITARDIVLRFGDTTAERIREELSGNLCRCTGYVGIVEAIAEVAKGKVATASQAELVRVQPAKIAAAAAVKPAQAAVVPSRFVAGPETSSRNGWTTIEQTLAVDFSPEVVWTKLSDIKGVSSCIPGAEITEMSGDRLTGRMNVALGPMKIAFGGDGTVFRDDAARVWRLTGGGKDAGSGSKAEGTVEWAVRSAEAAGSVIAVKLSWRLSGKLAQFNRGGLVQDVIQRLMAAFVTNLEASLRGDGSSAAGVKALSVWAMALSIIKTRLARLFRPSRPS